MNVVSYSNLKQNLKTYLDCVYNSLIETNYLLSNDANAEHLKKSTNQ